MFTGSIEQNVRSFIAAHNYAFQGQDIVVGCSGNFTSEKVLTVTSKPRAIYSNDVSLYSMVLADAMLEHRTEGVSLMEPDLYPWVHPWLEQDDLWFRAAAVMVFMKMLEFQKQANTYQRLHWKRYKDEFTNLVSTTAAGLAESAIEIAGYFGGDCFEHYQRHEDKDPIFFGFLPTYVGGYERIYKRLHEAISWPEPEYPPINDERRAEVHEWLAARRHLFITDHEVDGMTPTVVSARANFKTVYIYSNVVNQKAVFRKPVVDSGTRFVTIPPGYQFTAKTEIGIAPIRAIDIAYYKTAFLNPDISFVVGMFGFALLADDGVFGFCEFSPGKFDGRFFYMMADFPIEPKPHARTSKLVVMIAKSACIRDWLETKKLERSEGLCTTAWTHRPVSMKYRGVLKKTNAGETDDGRKYVNYQAEWSTATAQEMYTEWRKRHKVQ